MKCSDDDFIKIWNESDSRNQVAEKLSMHLDALSHKAAKLRKEGFELKSFFPDPKWKDDDFIQIWNNADTVDEVIRATGLSGAKQKADVLRKRGHALKILSKGNSNNLYYWSGVFDAVATFDTTSGKARIRCTVPTELAEEMKKFFSGASSEKTPNMIRLTWTGKNAEKLLQKVKSKINRLQGNES